MQAGHGCWRGRCTDKTGKGAMSVFGTAWQWIRDAAADTLAVIARNPLGAFASIALLAVTAGWVFVMWRRFVKGRREAEPGRRRMLSLWMGVGSTLVVALWVLLGNVFWETVTARQTIISNITLVPWRYQGELHACIASADRIVVRDCGYTHCFPEEKAQKRKILFEVSDPVELREVRELLVFQPDQTNDECMCCGYPRVDWYRGQERLALTSIQHGLTLRWKGFPGDAWLTEASSSRLVEWLARHGVEGPKKAVEERRARIEGNRKGRAELERLAPARFWETFRLIEREEETRRQDNKQPELSADEMLGYLRRVYGVSGDLCPDLFRVLGCLPLDWEKEYQAQGKARRMLAYLPKEELLAAFRSARRSEDPVVRKGAARALFSTSDSEWGTLPEWDLKNLRAEWAAVACADPFPCNRRMVLHALLEYKVTDVPEILNSALTDDDQTVRRRAMALLVMRGDAQAAQLLQKVVDGDIRPRPAPADLPTDWGAWADNQSEHWGLSEEYPDTDADAARKALAELRAKGR